MLIAVVAMFQQQTCGSVGRVLPAVLPPLIILELHAEPSWVGVYFGLAAVAALIGQLGSGGFIRSWHDRSRAMPFTMTLPPNFAVARTGPAVSNRDLGRTRPSHPT
jgi:hypothetical protein